MTPLRSLRAGAWSADTIKRWYRRGSRLHFSRNGVDLFDLPISPDTLLGFQAGIAPSGAAVEVLRFGEL